MKGSLALIEGRLQTRAWDDREGQKRRTTEIVADRIQLGPRPGGGRVGGDAPPGAPAAPALTGEVPVINVEDEVKAEDLPF